MASKPGQSHPDEELAKLSFDPGEVTATYPVGSLVKDLAQSKGQNSQPPGKGVAETVPVHEERAVTPPAAPKARRDEPNPAVLLGISLGIGGGLALVLLLIVGMVLWFLS